MQDEGRIFTQRANRGILACLEYLGCDCGGPKRSHPDEAKYPYYRLGKHPDLAEKLWDELTSKLKVDCRWIVHTRPVLAHPQTSVSFAFATGTYTDALRIPSPIRKRAKDENASQEYQYADGRVLDLTQRDGDWTFGRHSDNEEELCLIACQQA